MNLKENYDYKFPSACVALFAREPSPGRVKTRMQPLLGELGALSLHNTLISYVFNNLKQNDLCPIEFWIAGDEASSEVKKSPDKVFLSICNLNNIYWQKGADLGMRMQQAASSVLDRAAYVVLIGADCASVDAGYLEQALALLEKGESVVIGPADDGGYVLLGLRIVPEYLFIDVPWGTERVMELTRSRLAAAGQHWVELEPRWDVDRPEDLPRLAGLQPPFPIAY
jgi:rSAM/selenodomain-associated transferase 1